MPGKETSEQARQSAADRPKRRAKRLAQRTSNCIPFEQPAGPPDSKGLEDRLEEILINESEQLLFC